MAQATFWHPRFYELLRMQGPRWLRIHTESPLSEIASVVDMVFEKPDVKSSDPVNSLYGNDCIFADLWPRLGRLTIVEFKSVSRPCRALDLRRLLRCTMAYGDQHRREIATRDQLTAVLFVPRINRSLREEIAYIGGSLHELDAGYAKILGPILYTTYIVSLDDVAESEDNDFLRIFTSRCQVRDLRARRWMANWFQGGSAMQERELEGYDDAVSTFLASLEPEQRLAGLAAEERLAGLAAEERLAGLTVREVMQSMQLSAQDLLEVLPENERRDLRALLAQEERQG